MTAVAQNNPGYSSWISWITNLPAGLTQTPSYVDSTHAKITIAGQPSAANTDSIVIAIPSDMLAESDAALAVTANTNTKFAITASATPTITFNSNGGSAVDPVEVSSTMTLPTPTLGTYTFGG